MYKAITSISAGHWPDEGYGSVLLIHVTVWKQQMLSLLITILYYSKLYLTNDFLLCWTMAGYLHMVLTIYCLSILYNYSSAN